MRIGEGAAAVERKSAALSCSSDRGLDRVLLRRMRSSRQGRDRPRSPEEARAQTDSVCTASSASLAPLVIATRSKVDTGSTQAKMQERQRQRLDERARQSGYTSSSSSRARLRSPARPATVPRRLVTKLSTLRRTRRTRRDGRRGDLESGRLLELLPHDGEPARPPRTLLDSSLCVGRCGRWRGWRGGGAGRPARATRGRRRVEEGGQSAQPRLRRGLLLDRRDKDLLRRR